MMDMMRLINELPSWKGWWYSREVDGGGWFIICLGALLFLLVRDTSCLSLALPNLFEIETDGGSCKRVSLRGATIFLISSSEPPYESIKASPSLSKGACAGCWRFWLPIEHTPLKVNLGLPKLVQIPKEIQDMVAIALREWNWGSLILQVLPKSVPIPSLLRLIAAKCPCWGAWSFSQILATWRRHAGGGGEWWRWRGLFGFCKGKGKGEVKWIGRGRWGSCHWANE